VNEELRCNESLRQLIERIQAELGENGGPRETGPPPVDDH